MIPGTVKVLEVFWIWMELIVDVKELWITVEIIAQLNKCMMPQLMDTDSEQNLETTK